MNVHLFLDHVPNDDVLTLGELSFKNSTYLGSVYV